jgi:hypothetical protein
MTCEDVSKILQFGSKTLTDIRDTDDEYEGCNDGEANKPPDYPFKNWATDSNAQKSHRNTDLDKHSGDGIEVLRDVEKLHAVSISCLFALDKSRLTLTPFDIVKGGTSFANCPEP